MAKKQAVILIHGIGQSLPMDTLPGFVRFVEAMQEGGPDSANVWNKPDRISEGTDLRRLTMPARGKRPTTDFYENYWASHFIDGRFKSVLTWLLCHLFGFKTKHFGQLKSSIWVLRILIALGAVVAWILHMAYAADSQSKAICGLLALYYVLVAGFVMLLYFSAASVSDATRYLAPKPRDIDPRNRIRNSGVQLLKKLHESGQYKRIIVVGHSLGSVIGYDILRLYWDMCNKEPKPDRTAGTSPTLDTFDETADDILQGTGSRNARVQKFQELQLRLGAEYRKRGVNWLATDFVTLGSPLTHAESLLRSKELEFRKRVDDHELPACPPVTQRTYNRQKTRESCSSSFNKHGIRVPSSSAVFGPIVWTNIFFPTYLLFGGDVIGGPLRQVLGKGIRDVPVHASATPAWKANLIGQLPLRSHTQYWRRAARKNPPNSENIRGGTKPAKSPEGKKQTKDAASALINFLRL